MSIFGIFKKKEKEENVNDVNLTTIDSTNQNAVIGESTNEKIEGVSQPHYEKTARIQKPQLPNTVYNAVLKVKKNNFSRKDLRKISNIILQKFKKQNADAEPEKITQREGDKSFEVFCYPESMRKEIFRIVGWFYSLKETKSTKHQRLLKTESLNKLKKIGSPDYETELVKFNMAEEERRKQEKKKKTQESKFNQKKPQFNRDGKPKRSDSSRRNNFSNRNNNSDTKTFTKRRFTSDRPTPNKEGKNNFASNSNTSLNPVDRVIETAVNSVKSIDNNNG